MDGMGAKGMKTKLIVNYLPQNLTDVDFKNMFAQVGELDSCRVMRDRATNYSFGYGFVDFLKIEDAEAAITKLNGYKIANKTMRVAYSKPPGSSKNINLYVAGLTADTDEKKLEELFDPYGELVHTKILRNADGTSKGVGFALFKEKSNADAAIRGLQGHADGYGLNLQIKYAKDSMDQQRSHPKYQEYIHQKFMQQNPQMFNMGNTGGYAQDQSAYGGYGAQDPSQSLGYTDPYGGGYSTGGGGGDYNSGQKAVRGRDVSSRFNPIARPMSGGMGGGMGNNGMGMGMGGGGMGMGMGQVEQQSSCLFAYNIGPNATDADLYSLFSKYGRITKVNVIDGKGYGFVHMPIPFEANEAVMALNGVFHNGKTLQVSLKTQK